MRHDAYCPLTKEQCTVNCALFEESRRKYRDHIEGECSIVGISRIPDMLNNVSRSIDRLKQAIYDTDFTQ